MRITTGPRYRIDPHLGAEARCCKCNCWWPVDSEFYYEQPNGTPHSWCIACYSAWRNARYRNAKSPATHRPAATGIHATLRTP